MISSSNGISFPCESRVDDEVMDSRPTRVYLCNYQIKTIVQIVIYFNFLCGEIPTSVFIKKNTTDKICFACSSQETATLNESTQSDKIYTLHSDILRRHMFIRNKSKI